MLEWTHPVGMDSACVEDRPESMLLLKRMFRFRWSFIVLVAFSLLYAPGAFAGKGHQKDYYFSPAFFDGDLNRVGYYPVCIVKQSEDLEFKKKYPTKLAKLIAKGFIKARHGYKVKPIESSLPAGVCGREAFEGTDAEWVAQFSGSEERYVVFFVVNYVGVQGEEEPGIAEVTQYFLDTEDGEILWQSSSYAYYGAAGKAVAAANLILLSPLGTLIAGAKAQSPTAKEAMWSALRTGTKTLVDKKKRRKMTIDEIEPEHHFSALDTTD